MKRLLIIAASLAHASSSFAYYDSPFEMPGWFKFMGIVMIVWGVLEIMLFFKIWGMTNDIEALKKDYFNENHFESRDDLIQYLRKNLVLGNIDKVKRILLRNFIENVEQGYGELASYGYVKDENGNDKWASFEEQNLKESIRPYVENLQKQFDKIGEELPVYIQRMQCFGDYFNVFVKEELTVSKG
ncbi:MAG: hypothetical protein IJS63_06240 [Bacteroidaceae bacterium]|nr:hypothetical protein [Bacteroidaceae bacterium]